MEDLKKAWWAYLAKIGFSLRCEPPPQTEKEAIDLGLSFLGGVAPGMDPSEDDGFHSWGDIEGLPWAEDIPDLMMVGPECLKGKVRVEVIGNGSNYLARALKGKKEIAGSRVVSRSLARAASAAARLIRKE